jgi:hypothetical protein
LARALAPGCCCARAKIFDYLAHRTQRVTRWSLACRITHAGKQNLIEIRPITGERPMFHGDARLFRLG